MPLEFYHSTNKFEKYINIDKKAIVYDLQIFLKKFLLQAHGKQIISRDSINFDINTLEILNLSIENNEVQIFLYDYYSDKYKKSGRGYEYHLNFSLTIFSPPDTLENGELVINQLICTKNISKDQLYVGEIFRSGKIKIKWGDNGFWGGAPGEDCGLIFIPISIWNKINSYNLALQGFPSYSSGNYERMLYFSAMTITTMGMGDIVPISTRSRISVTIEAVLGLILIGLYLNSLARNIKKRN
jgi:hypothetical protein